MKLGRLSHIGAILLIAAVPSAAQEGADQWERGDDPVTLTNGLRHIASNIYVTCSPHGGFVRISVPAASDHDMALAAGDGTSSVFERTLTDGRLHGFTNVDDPLYAAALAHRGLNIDGKALGFSDKDVRYFSLLMRVCKDPS
jgi:hypothetical protein